MKRLIDFFIGALCTAVLGYLVLDEAVQYGYRAGQAIALQCAEQPGRELRVSIINLDKTVTCVYSMPRTAGKRVS
jgi:hypothetical protein